MAESAEHDNKIAELMQKLGLTGDQLQGVKLGPGVVGRNSTIAWVFLLVMLVGAVTAGYLHSQVLLGLSLGGAILAGVAIPVLNVYFGNKNPAAALMEGAEFLQYQRMQMRMAAKGIPVIESGVGVLAPPQLKGTGPRSQLKAADASSEIADESE